MLRLRGVRWRPAYALQGTLKAVRPSLRPCNAYAGLHLVFIGRLRCCFVLWVSCVFCFLWGASFLWASYVLTVGKRELAWEGRVRVKENPSGLGWGLVATTAGLEPVTSAVTGRRSNQLSYAAVVSALRLTTDRNTTAKTQLCKTAACHGVLGVARRSFAGKETNLSRSASRCRRRCGAPGWPAMRPKRTSQCPRHCTWRASPSPR